MTRTLSPLGNEAFPERSIGSACGFTVPSWLLSILVHAGLLAVLATLSWTVVRKPPERQFSVGIMVKKDTPEGELFESRDSSYETRTNSAESRFVPETDLPEVAQMLPQAPQVDLSTIGLSSFLRGSRDILPVPENAAQGGMSATTFIGVRAWGRKFVYVIDRSGSMSQRERLGVAKRELLASLEKLPPEAQFQVIFYNSNTELVPGGDTGKRLVYATDVNKKLVSRYLGTVIADGATDHDKALRTALSLGPDVIFFLTDAESMTAREVKELTELNEDRARIHTIELGIGTDVGESNMLRELANANGGSYRYVDANRMSGEAR